MAYKYRTFTDVTNALGDLVTADFKKSYDMAGESPQSVVSHTVQRDYNILGITPQEFIDIHGSTHFNFKDLAAEFKKICNDYGDPLTMTANSYAVEFCSRVIFEVGPESRQVKKKDGDKVWKMRFIYQDGAGILVKTAIISTFKSTNVVNTGVVDNDKIILTVKQAGLLAIETLSLINQIALGLTPPIMLLTPLAGAVFSKEDIPKIAKKAGVPTLSILTVINVSCQSGSQYLTHGRTHCAAIQAIVATTNMKDEKMRFGIINKVVKQYLNTGKTMDPLLFDTYAMYAHGGIPSIYSAENLIKIFDNQVKLRPKDAVIASKKTSQKSKIDVPATTSGEDSEAH